MSKYSKDVWIMARDTLRELGGENNWVQLGDIVNKIHEKWPGVNPHTIRCQVRIRCVNGHPSHDQFPDKGKMWREQPTFVSNNSGKYMLYNKDRDYQIYLTALAEDGISPDGITNKVGYKTITIPLPEITQFINESLNMHFNYSIELLEKYGKQLGFQTEREWEVPLGYIDLVWYKEFPMFLPHFFPRKYPVVGFEIETSARTINHIKGDILDLLALRAPTGIILQLTSLEDNPYYVENIIHDVIEFLSRSSVKNVKIWREGDLTRLENEMSSLSSPI